tara:strand:- start:1458 stop:1571 length:114 start_codon:yes stop_codon:yes gene_type:complete
MEQLSDYTPIRSLQGLRIEKKDLTYTIFLKVKLGLSA